MPEQEELILMLKNPQSRQDAFRRMVKLYSKSLYWTIRKIVLSHEDADDVLQNVFVKVWTSLDSYRGDAKIYTWLYRIAVNESLSFLRQQRESQHISVDDEENFLFQKMEADPYFDGDEAQMKFQKAILSLPEKQRLVFNMKYYDEMKYEEMEAVLGTSIGALKASYHYAVKKIEAQILK